MYALPYISCYITCICITLLFLSILRTYTTSNLNIYPLLRYLQPKKIVNAHIKNVALSVSLRYRRLPRGLLTSLPSLIGIITPSAPLIQVPIRLSYPLTWMLFPKTHTARSYRQNVESSQV